MSQIKPKCPYCGGEMRIERAHESGLSYACPTCWSESPFVVYKPCEDTATICYEAAFRRPLQKPLTKEELLALIDTNEDVVTYCEAIGDDHAYATIWYQGKNIDRDGEAIENDDLTWFAYGIRWRAWATRPTDEERAAAPWEE